jgi:hypothetical protein
MKKRLYAEVPEDLKALSDEELRGLHKSYKDSMKKAASESALKEEERDAEWLGELSLQDVIDQTREAAETYKAIAAVLDERAKDQETFAETVGTAVLDAIGEEPEPEPEPAEPSEPEIVAEEEGEPEPEPEPEPEVARELVTASSRAARPRPTPEHTPVETSEEPRLSLRSKMTGLPISDRMEMAKLIADMNDGGMPGGIKTVLASADWGELYPKGRRLGFESMEPFDIQQRIRETTAPEVLVASGGLCAPVTPYYELAMLSVGARPVRDALASFNAVRGGLQFARPALITDVAAGVGIKTAANDALGGTFATKNSLAVACPNFSTVNLEMIYRILKFGNLNARAFPELIAQWLDLSIAYHARVADSALLDYIHSTATQTTQAKVYGTASTIIDTVLYAVAGVKSRNRMNPDMRFRCLAPAWLREAIAADVVNTQFQRFDVKADNVDALLGSYGVDVTWYLDTETGGSQVFGAQSAGALLDFPSTAKLYVFHEGAYLFLDGGTLDLGIVRDSVLNATNDFQIFAETFEAAAYVGIDALEIVATICNDGTVANPATAITC